MKKFLVYGLSDEWGGVENIVLSIIERLKEKHHFDIIVPNSECSYECRYNHPSIKFIHMITWGENRTEFREKLLDLHKATTYDYVWINSSIMSNRTIIETTKKHSKAKIITHAHGSSFEEKNFIKRNVLLALHHFNKHYYLHNIDYPVSCSMSAARWLYGKYYCEKNKVYVVNSGIDTAKFKYNEGVRSQMRQELCTGNSLCLFHSGRLTMVKNQMKLISILSYIINKGFDAKLFIAGDGELKDDLVRFSKHLRLESNVVFLGLRNDIDKLCQAMDIFLLPSLHEGFPLSIVEAQASGLQCIASTGVPKETNLTGSVKYIDVNEDDSVWANAILTFPRNNDRRMTYKSVVEKGFDINNVAVSFEKHIGINSLA